MFTRIHHVAVVVRSLEEALPFYRDVLGLPVGLRATVADQGVHAVLLPTPDGEIELLEPADPTGGVARFLERRGEGPHHLCFETPDISAALARARALDLPLIDRSPRRGLAGMIAFLHPKASHGVLVEMAQPVAPSAHPESSRAGIRALGIQTVYVAVTDLAAGATTYGRNFHGGVRATLDDAGFCAKRTDVSVGSSRVALLGTVDRVSPVGCFLAERGEGLFGLCLRVADFGGALRYLEDAGVPSGIQERHTTPPLARLDPAQTHGLNLFLSPDSIGPAAALS